MHPVSKKILHIAVPSIISNITVPLLGLIDVTIVGHLGAASYIGAIAIGGMLFNMIYLIFGFLRMGTSGMTSQALGAHKLDEVVRLLLRSTGISLILSLLLILLQTPILDFAFRWVETTAEVRQLATSYFRICIWGAPATLLLYSLSGWYIGMQNSRIPMWIAISQNIINILASLCFVYVFHMKVEGVALGTLIAQYGGLFMALLLWFRHYGSLRKYFTTRQLTERHALLRFFNVNRDIFLRTLCLVAVTVFFTSTGAAHGEVILAVNTLLMQLFTLFSYIMDGFAYAGEALTGKYIGARNYKELSRTIKQLFGWGLGMAFLFTLLYGIGGTAFLGLLTNDTTVIEAAHEYLYWAMAIPLTGFAAFLFDGIFIGATATYRMLQSMFIASCSFFLVYYSLHDAWGNHALWLSFIVYLSLRGVIQAFLARNLIKIRL